ncbi:hypothetical protein SAMN04488570_2751 [Nocardioides scoriae]|uniref:ABM domain-containing protein n=1 Tax=Nocardioides scoriae TaxID=642780 RepID=A0A1H1V9C8_9ACTN|nr:hypothetical protein SAMN04488570_2751 [Nocardioides scoriae]
MVLHKRWRLHDGVTTDQVARLVAERVVPHYARLSDQVVLGLEADEDGTVVALQRWSSREALAAATSGTAYDRWWAAYLPVLAEWDRLVSFQEEWETTVLL